MCTTKATFHVKNKHSYTFHVDFVRAVEIGMLE